MHELLPEHCRFGFTIILFLVTLPGQHCYASAYKKVMADQNANKFLPMKLSFVLEPCEGL